MTKRNQKNKIDWYVITRVKEIRISLGHDQADVAIHLNVSNGFIGQIESPNYRSKYNSGHLNELAKFFKCSPKDFWPEKPL